MTAASKEVHLTPAILMSWDMEQEIIGGKRPPVEGLAGGSVGSLGVGCCPLGWECAPGGLASDKSGLVPGPGNRCFPCLQSWLWARPHPGTSAFPVTTEKDVV